MPFSIDLIKNSKYDTCFCISRWIIDVDLEFLNASVLVSIVMMNLLVALAVNDMKKLAKNAKRDQLYSQVELISYMERLESLWIFKRVLPSNFQDFFRKKLMKKGKGFRMTLDVNFCDNKKQILPKPLQNELLDFCMR